MKQGLGPQTHICVEQGRPRVDFKPGAAECVRLLMCRYVYRSLCIPAQTPRVIGPVASFQPFHTQLLLRVRYCNA